MKRTKNRPLVIKSISPIAASIFAVSNYAIAN